VVPIFAVMLFGMIQFGLVFAGWTSLRNSVQTGARMVAVGDFGPYAGQPLSPAPCPALAAAPSQPSDGATADGYCAIVDEIGAPLGTTASSTVAPYPEVGFYMNTSTEVLTVCAQVQAQNITGVFNLALSSNSNFFIGNDPETVSNYDPYGICPATS